MWWTLGNVSEKKKKEASRNATHAPQSYGDTVTRDFVQINSYSKLEGRLLTQHKINSVLNKKCVYTIAYIISVFIIYNQTNVLIIITTFLPL